MRTGPQRADFSDVRLANLAVVLRHIRASAPCSRADIAAATGLNKATVSSLVAELIERRMLRETGLVEHRIGRPATMIVIDGSTYAAIGLAVSADHLSVEAVDLAGERVLSWRRAFPGLGVTPSRAAASIVTLVRKAVARVAGDGRQVLGLTVGIPGLVSTEGIVTIAASLGWSDVDLAGLLTAGLRDGSAFPVVIENDATLVALAEHRFGSHAGTADLVALSGEVGGGAGIISDGHPLRGATGYAGEIGHLSIDPGGPPCPCGRQGCLEAVAGIPALIADLNPHGGDQPITDFEPEVLRMVERAASGDESTLAALRRAGTGLGRAASVVSNLLNPEVVILGGYYVPLARWVLPAAAAELAAGTGPQGNGGCRLVASSLSHGAAALGGAARILDAIDAGQFPASDSRSMTG